jgi:signal transduction histidine kinase
MIAGGISNKIDNTKNTCQRPTILMSTEDHNQVPDIPKEIDYLTRQKVVRQLHDGLTQTVSALAMRINFTRRIMATDPEAASAELEKVEDLTREATKEIRHIIYLLRPENWENSDLILELDSLAEKMHNLFEVEIKLDIDPGLVAQLAEDVLRVVYALIEEGIDSARKGGGIPALLVSLNLAESLLPELSIQDQGASGVKEPAFQGLELDNFQTYASLIEGTVIVDPNGYWVRVLFPLKQVIDE